MTTRRIKLYLLISLLAAGAACGPEGCCAPPIQAGTGIIVINPEVRACDLLLRASGDEVPTVEFGSAVTGEFVPKAPMVGASFVANEDATLEGQELGRMVFTLSGQTAELVSSTCFNAAGEPLDGTLVRLTE